MGLFDDVEWAVEEIALPKEFSLSIVSDGLLDYLPGDSLSANEQELLDACARAQMSHESICAELRVMEITDALDDVSLLTVVRKSHDA